MNQLRSITWVGSSKYQLVSFPEEVQKEIGFALHLVQEGKMPHNSKPLKGLGSGVMEIVSDFDKCTFRAVYAVKIGEYIYVLHAFQKKSTIGIKTAKQDIDLIKQRLLAAKNDANNRSRGVI